MNNTLKIVNILKSGGVVLMQVDTIYGLICDGLNDLAIRKIEKIKHRNKPSFSFFVRDVNIAKKYAELSLLQEKCFQTVFPGYFTLILPASNLAINTIQERTLGNINNLKTIGLRVPKNNLCLNILKYFDTPLLATSANISGEKTATKFEEIKEEIIKSVDFVFYNKNEKIAGSGSTIIDITNPTNGKIIRAGSGDINIINEIISFQKKI
jgi:L-threonylcarbamoyladenylate synthase